MRKRYEIDMRHQARGTLSSKQLTQPDEGHDKPSTLDRAIVSFFS